MTCHLPSPAVTTAATIKSHRHHRRRRRRSRAAIAVPDCPARVVPTTLAAPTAPSPTQTQPPLPSPDIVSQPAKRTRKRQNELKLLRDWEGNDQLLVSPPPPGRTTPPSLPCTPTLTTPPSQSNPLPGTPPTVPTRSLAIEPVSPLLEPHMPPVLPTSPVPMPEPVLPPEPASLLEPTATPTSPTPMSPPSSSPPSQPSPQSSPAPPDSSLDTLVTTNIPVAPPMSSYLPSSPFKVICRCCTRDCHDIRYRQCPGCCKRRGGLNYFGW